MWLEKFDDSAIQLTEMLRPNGIDRTKIMPLAAIAIWSVSRGRIALETRKGESGCWFPRGEDELPAIDAHDRSLTVEQAANLLTPIVERLRVPLQNILRVSGLFAWQTPTPTLLIDDAVPGQARRVGLLPYRIDLEGQPQLAGMIWHSPTEASQQLGCRPTAMGRATGGIMLTRTMTGHVGANH